MADEAVPEAPAEAAAAVLNALVTGAEAEEQNGANNPEGAGNKKKKTEEKEDATNIEAEEDIYDQFAESWEDSDIVFVVEEQEFHCHYLVLRLNSPVFKVMFTSPGFKEGKEKRVTLPGKEKESFFYFLKLIYPHSPEDVFPTDRESRNIIRNVLAYGEEYQIECIKMHIDKLLATHVYADLNVEVAKLDYYGGGEETMKQVPSSLEDLQMCEIYELKETKRMIIQFLIIENRCMSYDNTMFNELLGNTKFDILTGKLNAYFLSTYNTTYCNQPWFNILKSVSNNTEYMTNSNS